MMMINPCSPAAPAPPACRNWVNAPELAAQQSELLTRDADRPEEASGESVAPPPPSKLASQTLAAAAAANGVSAPPGVASMTSKLAGLKVRGAAAASNGRVAVPTAARAAV
jgi:hypothetical protein